MVIIKQIKVNNLILYHNSKLKFIKIIIYFTL